MSISGTSPSPPGPAAFTSQAGTERPGTSEKAGPSKPAALSFSPPEGLAQKKFSLALGALDRHDRRVETIHEQIERRTDLSASFRSRAIQEEVNEEHRKLRRTLSEIKQSVSKPASNEPQRRIVGFNAPSGPAP